MPIEEGYLYKLYHSGGGGAGVEGDAIADDGEHPIPESVLPIVSGDGIKISKVGANREIVLAADLRAFEGTITTAGTSPTFGYLYRDGGATSTGAITGDYAAIAIGDAVADIRVEQVEFDTATNVLKLGLSGLTDSSAFDDEELSVTDSAGATRTVKLGDAARKSVVNFGSTGARSGYAFEWNFTAQTRIWTGNVTNVPWRITAPITVLNYVPHATPAENKDLLFNINGRPGWTVISVYHLPDAIKQEIVALQNALGKTTSDQRLNYLLYGKGTDFATVFPLTQFDAGAIAMLESPDGTSWDIAMLRENATTSVATLNRNRVILDMEVLSGDDVDYSAGAILHGVTENYRDVVHSFEIRLTPDDNEANVALNLTAAVYGSTPTQLYCRMTGYDGVLTIPRGTAGAGGTGTSEHPRYFTNPYENATEFVKWRAIVSAAIAAAPDHQINITFFSDSAGLTPVNFIPANALNPGAKTWESFKPPDVDPRALRGNTQPWPRSKWGGATATTYLHDGSGPGLAITSSGRDVRSTLLTLELDLNATQNQRGVLEVEAVLTIANPSHTSIGFGTDRKTSVTLAAFHNAATIRAAGNEYSSSATNGQQYDDTIELHAESETTAGDYIKIGEVQMFVAWSTLDSEKKPRVYFYYDGEADTRTLNIGANPVEASFRHEDTSAAPAATPIIDLVELSARSPATGSTAVTKGDGTPPTIDIEVAMEIISDASILNGTDFTTISRGGAGTDYFQLTAGVYAISLGSEYTLTGGSGGGDRISPEFALQRSTDGGTTWADIPATRNGRYSKNPPQGRSTLSIAGSCHIIATAAERFRFRLHRFMQNDGSSTLQETAATRASIAKLS